MLDMLGNYDSRKVARTEEDGMFVSTARVTDGRYTYETAVADPHYNDGDIIILYATDSYEEAVANHSKAINLLRSNPEVLIDCQNSWISNMVSEADLTFYRKEK